MSVNLMLLLNLKCTRYLNDQFLAVSFDALLCQFDGGSAFDSQYAGLALHGERQIELSDLLRNLSPMK